MIHCNSSCADRGDTWPSQDLKMSDVARRELLAREHHGWAHMFLTTMQR